MLRGLYDNSTDLLYSEFPDEDLIEVANAIGASDIKIVTTATLQPQRAFFHSCLNGVQNMVRIKEIGEVERGEKIAELANGIATKLRPAFFEGLADSEALAATKYSQLNDYVSSIDESQKGKSWDAESFSKEWLLEACDYRWQSKAIETYALARSRIESGEYEPSEGWDAKRVTEYWGARNLEYKHYRDIGRGIVEEYIQENFAEELITMHDIADVQTVYFFGAMASGKSVLSNAFLERLPEEVRGDMVLHDADYLKPALAKRAIREGMIEDSNGVEVQNESSNALYEGTRKRSYYARAKGMGHNLLINSICLNELEVTTALQDGELEAHFISIDPEKAIDGAAARAVSTGREHLLRRI